jgi:predicted enzyme related to lactoylglutathione lyase
MTTDTKAAAAFYTKVAGWKTKPWEEDRSYTMFTANGRPMGGLMALPEPAAPTAWMVYIGAPNVDDAVRQVEGLGGKVLKKPTDIPTIGRFAVVQDPQGAMFNAFTPLPRAGSPDASATAATGMSVALGDFSWHELTTTDWRAALTFYKNLFGWEETESMDMGPEMGTYQMFGWKGHTLGGMMNTPKQNPQPPAWLPYISVADSKKAAVTIKKLGGQILHGPAEVPGGGWIVMGRDPQGAAFALHSAQPAANPQSAAKAKPTRKAAAKKPARKSKPPKRTKKTKGMARKAAKRARPARSTKRARSRRR